MKSGCLRPGKIDAPFATDAEVGELVQAFEECRWPYSQWTHRAHLAVAVVYLTRYRFPATLDRIRVHINLYNRAVGKPDGYHETLTVLYLRGVQRYLLEQIEPPLLPSAVEELAQRYDSKWPLRFYSPERLWSTKARAEWVEPDRGPLDEMRPGHAVTGSPDPVTA